MLIDTHCHLDAPEFDGDREAVIHDAARAGVRAIVIPAVESANFGVVRDLAARVPGGAYALGIHPLYVPRATDDDLDRLRDAVMAALPDPRFVAIGEIGLDFFVVPSPAVAGATPAGEPARRQQHFYQAQLKLAREFGLPVLLHVRRAQDMLLKFLRRIDVPGGIAHAFNGSEQQARAFVDRGFALGFGGEMTFERARNIRRLAARFGPAHGVLETDAPDIPPAWLDGPVRRNAPAELPRIAAAMADVCGMTAPQLRAATARHALRVLPRLAHVPGLSMEEAAAP